MYLTSLPKKRLLATVKTVANCTHNCG